MNSTTEQQLREGLARLRDASSAQPFDPNDDLARGRAAARRSRFGSMAGAAASVTVVAVAAALWLQGAGTPTSRPAGALTSSAVAIDGTPTPASSTPAAPPSATAPPLTTGQLGLRMIATVRSHAAGADRYLGSWGDDSSGAGIRSSSDSHGLGRFGITVSWGRPGASSLGGVEIGSTTAHFAGLAGQTDGLRCNGEFTDSATSVCRLVRQGADGSRLYYGSTRTTRAASYTYPDGRLAYVSVTTRQRGNSLTETTAPLPTQSELVAIVTDPRLTWDSPLVEASFYDPPGGTRWGTPPAGHTP